MHMKKLYYFSIVFLLFGCKQQKQKIFTKSIDSVEISQQIPIIKVPVKPKTVTFKKDLFKVDSLSWFYDSLVSIHMRTKIYDSVMGYDFGTVSLDHYRDTLSLDSITETLNIRTDYEDSLNKRFFVRYMYASNRGLVDTQEVATFYIWKDILKNSIERHLLGFEVEYRDKVSNSLLLDTTYDVRRSNLRQVMRFVKTAPP